MVSVAAVAEPRPFTTPSMSSPTPEPDSAPTAPRSESDTGSLRLFFALWPDANTRAALARLQFMRGRKVPYENLHITLAFLGQQPATLLPLLKDILAHLPRTEIVLTLDRLSYFNRNRIAWAGMHQVPDALPELQQTLAQELVKHGIAFDNGKNFKPHVTLVREAQPPPDTAFTPIVWQADHLALVQSVTLAEGPRYEVLASRWLNQEVRTPDERGPGGIGVTPE